MIGANDLHVVTLAPTYLMLHTSCRYDGNPSVLVDGWALYVAPSKHRHVLRMPSPLMTLTGPRTAMAIETITLDRRTFAKVERFERNSRRREARRFGRRNACPVPLRTEWEARICCEAGVDERAVARAAEVVAVVVARAWRRGSAVDWARRNCNLRQRRERRKVTP